MSDAIRSMPLFCETDRLRLRRWTSEDKVPFAALNADPIVMEHFPAPLSREESDAMVDRIEERFGVQGFGLWAVEVKSSGTFIGFVGLAVPRFEAHFTPCVEIGWRLAKEHWGKGYAPEAASTVLRDGFERVGLNEIVAMTTTTNKKSMRVMEKLGMMRNPDDDFDHPMLAEGHPLRRHVLYRIKR